MSRTSCFANFSGSSAFAMMSLMLARKRVPTRSRSAMMNLLSKRVAKRMDELASEITSVVRTYDQEQRAARWSEIRHRESGAAGSRAHIRGSRKGQSRGDGGGKDSRTGGR